MDPIRQAALVVASLDRKAADDLLERMPLAQAQAIRDQLVLLEDVNGDESEDAIGQFFRLASSDDINEVSRNDSSELPKSEHRVSTYQSPLDELLQHEDTSIAEAIRNERSSIVAALLRSLPQRRAANVLQQLPTQLQGRVLTSLNQGQIAKSAMIEVIADSVCELLSDRSIQGTPQQVDPLQAIFDELPQDEQQRMLQSLELENPMLAQRLHRTGSRATDVFI